jgi:hypothetical protein
MKINEFLSEETLKPASFYKLDRLNAFINRLETGGKFVVNDTGKKITLNPTKKEINALKALRKEYDSVGDMPGGHSGMRGKIPLEIGGVKLSSLFKDTGLGGGGGVKGEKNIKPEDAAKSNIGSAVEAWKAIGVFTKLIHREDRDITLQDMMAVKDILNANMKLEKKISSKGATSKTQTAVSKDLRQVPDFNKKVNDSISIDIDVGLGGWQRAMAVGEKDPELFGRIQGILKFINENQALKRYSKLFSLNGRVDPIKIAVVGGAGEKTDVQTSFIKDPTTKDYKPLASLNFSLKAGNKGVSQSPATTNEGIRIFFDSLGLDVTDAEEAMKQTGYFEKPRGAVETPATIEKRVNAIRQIFNIAAQKLEQKFAGDDTAQEAEFINHFLNRMTHIMTSGKNMIFVDFDAKGTYNKLNPHSIKNLAGYVNLEAKVINKADSYLFVYDKNSGRSLIHVRLQKFKTGRWNLKFELDKMLELTKEATDKLNLQKANVVPQKVNTVTQPVRPGANKSVATQPKPALKVSQPQMGQEPVNTTPV